MSVRVVATTPDDLKWPHRIDSGDKPVYRCKAGTYEREFAVDPHPAYQADVKLVEQLVDECADRFPLNGADLNVYVLSHEFLSRVNGLTIYGTVYYDDKGNRIEIPIKGGPNDEERKFGGIAHLIVLSAKRIPIHPAFLRYLVAHEYGHCAFNHVRRRLGYLDHEDGKLEEKYLEIRGCKPSGSDKWHALASEIIANDFRTLVMLKEEEFWPHEVPQAEGLSPTWEWWQRARELCAQEGP